MINETANNQFRTFGKQAQSHLNITQLLNLNDMRASLANSVSLISGLFLVLLTFSPHAFAATAITIDSSGCATIGGSWSDPVCTLDQDYTLAIGSQIIVPANNALIV